LSHLCADERRQGISRGGCTIFVDNEGRQEDTIAAAADMAHAEVRLAILAIMTAHDKDVTADSADVIVEDWNAAHCHREQPEANASAATTDAVAGANPNRFAIFFC
jgi:hypothetical protein